MNETTARQLRTILFEINQGDMTVAQLRERLYYDIQDQDKPLTADVLRSLFTTTNAKA